MSVLFIFFTDDTPNGQPEGECTLLKNNNHLNFDQKGTKAI